MNRHNHSICSGNNKHLSLFDFPSQPQSILTCPWSSVCVIINYCRHITSVDLLQVWMGWWGVWGNLKAWINSCSSFMLVRSFNWGPDFTLSVLPCERWFIRLGPAEVLQLFVGQIVLHRLTLNKPGSLTPSHISHKNELLRMIPKSKLSSTKLWLLGTKFRGEPSQEILPNCYTLRQRC